MSFLLVSIVKIQAVGSLAGCYSWVNSRTLASIGELTALFMANFNFIRNAKVR